MARRRRVAGMAVGILTIALLGVVAVSPAGAAPGRAQEWGTGEEQAFVARINELRASKGLAPLAVDPELTSRARVWSQTMKDAGRIFHDSDLSVGVTADWQKLGENVGVGGTVDALFDAFVASPAHYENLVDPAYRFVGIGVVWDGERMFTAHRFMALLPPRPPTPAPLPEVSEDAPAPDGGSAPVEAPEELAAVDTPEAPVAPVPQPAPASAAQVALVLDTIAGALA